MNRVFKVVIAMVAIRHQPRHRLSTAAFATIAFYTALLLPSDPARAANADTCEKVTALLWAVDEVATEWSDSTRANKMAVTRLSMKAMAALGSAERANGSDSLPDDMITEIETIRDGIVGDTEQLQTDPEAFRPLLLSSGLIIADTMADACPAADLPDLTAHHN